MAQERNFPMTIFLAEDDEDDSILFLEVVRELHPDITVKVSQDGQQLLDDLRRSQMEQPEILFLDINMPLKNGFECLKEIKDSGIYRGMKIIMFSTSSSTMHIEISYKLGADFYAVKPGSFQHLKEMLAGILAIDWKAALRNKKNFLLVAKKMNVL